MRNSNKNIISRRDFLRLSAATTAAASATLYGGDPLAAQLFGRRITIDERQKSPFLVHLLLEGGPDMRHLIAPPWSDDRESYGHAYWTHHREVHMGRYNNSSDMRQRYQRDYIEVEGGNLGRFGILRRAGYLADLYRAGEVAIVANADFSRNRNHTWSLLIAQSGDPNCREGEMVREGWGGRLAELRGEKVASMSSHTRLFCFPRHGRSRSESILSVADSRQLGLYDPQIFYHGEESISGGERYNSQRARLQRALSGYYERKVEESVDPAMQLFFEHEQASRKVGATVAERLASIPDYFEGYPASVSAGDRDEALQLFRYPNTFLDQSFGRQMRNLYDTISLSDLFDSRIASLHMNGWDSHKQQMDTIEPKFNQLFGNELEDRQGKPITGRSGSIRTLYDLLPEERRHELLFVCNGDFGRQLKANGARGTDHGRGNLVLLIGKSLRGGVYGELFPDEERERYALDNQDTIGRTGLARIFGAVGEKMGVPARSLFPWIDSTPIESAGMFENLFRS